MNPTPGPWDPPAAIPGGNLGGPTGGGGGVPVQRHASQELYQGSFGAPGGVAGEGFGGGGGGPGGGGGGGPGFDSFANEMIGNNAAAQMGLRYGKDMVQSSLGKYLPGAHLAWDSLKGYFLVDNKYVTTKMKLLLFPYRQKAWERRPAGSGGFASPIDDPMAPDLYIPVMAGCTYVILVGLAKGSNLKFSPDVLVDVATTCIVTQLVEVAIFKAGMHIFAERPHFTPSFLDLVAYTGYKYVALVINILAGLTLGWMAYYFSLAVNGIAMFAFVMFTIKAIVAPRSNTEVRGQRRQTYFIFGAGLLQLFLIWWLGYTRDLSAVRAAVKQVAAGAGSDAAASSGAASSVGL